MLKNLIIIISVFAVILAIRSYFTHKNYKSSMEMENELRQMQKDSKSTTVLTPNDILSKHQTKKENQAKIKNLSIWEDLIAVKYDKNENSYKPSFDSRQKKWENKEIVIEGYLIPIEAGISGKSFLFSLYPYQSCFFCGGAGIETMIEVKTENEITYTDQAIKIKGILLLNQNTDMSFFYGLKNAVQE
jgi:hypothetical protein